MNHLDAIWRRLRFEIIARAEGGTGAYDADSGGHQKPGSSPPPADSGDLTHFDHRWHRCLTDRDRRRMLLCAECADPRAKAPGLVRCCVVGLLRSYMLTKPNPVNRKGTQDWRRAVALDERASGAVARAYGIREATVLRHRQEFGVERSRGGRRPGAGRPRNQTSHV